MEQQAQYWRILVWWMGISVTVTLFLAGWMWWIVGQLHQKATYKWIEEQFSRDIKDEIRSLNLLLKDIRDCMIGDFKSEGVVTKVSRNEHKIAVLEKTVQNLRG